jgi:hypothetical protein
VQWRDGVSCAASLPKLQPSALDQPEPYGQHHKVDEKVRGGLQLAKEEQVLAERNKCHLKGRCQRKYFLGFLGFTFAIGGVNPGVKCEEATEMDVMPLIQPSNRADTSAPCRAAD